MKTLLIYTIVEIIHGCFGFDNLEDLLRQHRLRKSEAGSVDMLDRLVPEKDKLSLDREKAALSKAGAQLYDDMLGQRGQVRRTPESVAMNKMHDYHLVSNAKDTVKMNPYYRQSARKQMLIPKVYLNDGMNIFSSLESKFDNNNKPPGFNSFSSKNPLLVEVISPPDPNSDPYFQQKLEEFFNRLNKRNVLNNEMKTLYNYEHDYNNNLGYGQPSPVGFRKMGFNAGGTVLGVPGHIGHLPVGEPLLPGHTLIRPVMNALVSSVKFPHKELDAAGASGVYGNQERLSLGYPGTDERWLYTSFRRLLDQSLPYVNETPNQLSGGPPLQRRRRAAVEPSTSTTSPAKKPNLRDVEISLAIDLKKGVLKTNLKDLLRLSLLKIDPQSIRIEKQTKNSNGTNSTKQLLMSLKPELKQGKPNFRTDKKPNIITKPITTTNTTKTAAAKPGTVTKDAKSLSDRPTAKSGPSNNNNKNFMKTVSWNNTNVENNTKIAERKLIRGKDNKGKKSINTNAENKNNKIKKERTGHSDDETQNDSGDVNDVDKIGSAEMLDDDENVENNGTKPNKAPIYDDYVDTVALTTKVTLDPDRHNKPLGRLYWLIRHRDIYNKVKLSPNALSYAEFFGPTEDEVEKQQNWEYFGHHNDD